MEQQVWDNCAKKRGHNCTKWAHCAKREQMEHWEKYAQSANFRGVTWDLADMYSKHLPADQHTTSPETQVMEIVHLIRNILNSELWSQLCELWLFWYWWWWQYYVNRIKSSSNLATCKYLEASPFRDCYRQQTIPSFFHTKKTCPQWPTRSIHSVSISLSTNNRRFLHTKKIQYLVDLSDQSRQYC